MVRSLGRFAVGLPFALLAPATDQRNEHEINGHLSRHRRAKLGLAVKNRGISRGNAGPSTRKTDDRQVQAAKRSNPELKTPPPEWRGSLLVIWTGQPEGEKSPASKAREVYWALGRDRGLLVLFPTQLHFLARKKFTNSFSGHRLIDNNIS